MGNQRNNTNVLCFGLCEKGGVQLSNPLFVYFVLHLCAGLSLTGGGMWPRPGRYVLQF